MEEASKPEQSSDSAAADSGNRRRHESASSIQDRILNKLLQQVIPPDDVDDAAEGTGREGTGRKSKNHTTKPGFSLPIMTSNFRRFNARIGVVFIFQAQLIRLLTWDTPSHTLSLLFVYTFVTLNPHLLAILPFALVLFFILVPAFLQRHPPPPSPSLSHPSYALSGPPLAPPKVIRPVTEMSHDFFRNIRDLQNTMDDFSTVHDLVLSAVTPSTNFSDEPFSSALFIGLTLASCVLFLAGRLLPWRAMLLLAGYTALALGHPAVQELVKAHRDSHIRPAASALRSYADVWIAQDIVLDTAPEKREVEIFELQRRRGAEWEAWLFGASAWEPLASARLAGERAKGTRFFEDVRPPPGWEWEGKKWVLDLASREWVEERMMAAVEVEVEGERWVYDAGGEWRRRRWVRAVRRRVPRAGAEEPKEGPRTGDRTTKRLG